jgi:hypothetical protein
VLGYDPDTVGRPVPRQAQPPKQPIIDQVLVPPAVTPVQKKEGWLMIEAFLHGRETAYGANAVLLVPILKANEPHFRTRLGCPLPFMAISAVETIRPVTW